MKWYYRFSLMSCVNNNRNSIRSSKNIQGHAWCISAVGAYHFYRVLFYHFNSTKKFTKQDHAIDFEDIKHPKLSTQKDVSSTNHKVSLRPPSHSTGVFSCREDALRNSSPQKYPSLWKCREGGSHYPKFLSELFGGYETCADATQGVAKEKAEWWFQRWRVWFFLNRQRVGGGKEVEVEAVVLLRKANNMESSLS